jgi:hypothetical protein
MYVYKPAEITEQTEYDRMYTTAMHVANLGIAHGVIERFGNKSTTPQSPWLHATGNYGDSLVKVESSAGTFTTTIVSTRNPNFWPPKEFADLGGRLAPLFIRDQIKLQSDAMSVRSKIYPPLRQILGILLLNQPLSSGFMMGYPTIDHDAPQATLTLQETAGASDLRPASLESVTGLYAERSSALRRWVRVKLPDACVEV